MAFLSRAFFESLLNRSGLTLASGSRYSVFKLLVRLNQPTNMITIADWSALGKAFALKIDIYFADHEKINDFGGVFDVIGWKIRR